MKRLLLIILLFLFLVQGTFSLGNKDKDKPDETDWKGINETVLFGLIKIDGNKVVINAHSDESGETVYRVLGNKKNEVEDAAGKYIFVRGKLTKEKSPKINVTQILVIQDSPEPEWGKAKQMKIEGIVESGMNNMVCIVVNPESRSRISHYVFGTLKNDIEENIGMRIEVEGFVIMEKEDETPFVKEIIVEKIISLSE